MTPALQLEILDLRHFSSSNLRPVLEAEGSVWNQLLRWDFEASANLLLQYLDSHVLPGYVALENGRVRGYIFSVYEGNKAVIGDVFAVPSAAGTDSSVEVEDKLLRHLVELLQHSPGVSRIESQLLLHPHGTHAGTLMQSGFRVYERLFMELDLVTMEVRQPIAVPDSGILQMRLWRDSDFAAAGRLIAQAYQGHLDGLINDQYHSVAGSLRFLHNIVRFPGCGVFNPEASWVLTLPNREDLAGLLLCSRVHNGTGHVTQICIAPQFRRRGLAGELLTACAQALKNRGYQALTLTVTAENAAAVSLYEHRGFVTRHTFDAMVWNQDERLEL